MKNSIVTLIIMSLFTCSFGCSRNSNNDDQCILAKETMPGYYKVLSDAKPLEGTPMLVISVQNTKNKLKLPVMLNESEATTIKKGEIIEVYIHFMSPVRTGYFYTLKPAPLPPLTIK